MDLSVRDLSKIHFSSFLQSVNTEQKGDKLKEKPTQIAEGLFGHKTSLQLLPGKHPQSLWTSTGTLFFRYPPRHELQAFCRTVLPSR